jgi:type II secretory pathway component GspD/PulD (secretin)
MAVSEGTEMLNRNVLNLVVMGILVVAGVGSAQNQEAPKSAEPQKFYKLEFVVKEVEGSKVLNARSYSMTVAADTRETASMRTGSRVPFVVGSGNSVQYIDIGVNIDCRSIREVQDGLALFLTAEISSVPSESQSPASTGAATPPVVRQNKWSSSAIVPLKRATLVFSSDDVASKRQMQLELTATPIRQ